MRKFWGVAAMVLTAAACSNEAPATTVANASDSTTAVGSTTIMMQETGSSGTTAEPMITEGGGGGTMTGGDTGDPTTGDPTTAAEPSCGDGLVDDGEQCDDGPSNGPGQVCKADCTLNVCGDGDQGPGEQCDAGPDNADDGLCKTDCTQAACGDGLVQPGEGCDDGNQIDDDTCTNECKLASCGDGKVQPPEQCDDGNPDDTDACTASCVLPVCGDGVVQASNDEACDDGANNDDNGDCTSQCKVAVCGDGLVHNGGMGAEQCDDGNDVDLDACSNACAAANCDDLTKNANETDVDCGGIDCNACTFGQACAVDGDCTTGVCEAGKCAWPQTCMAIKQKDPGASSGQYTIDVDGDGPQPAFVVQCDMQTEGGGWTLIANLNANRIPQSIHRSKRFFTAAWKQLLNGNEVTTNDKVALGGDVYGMLDAQALIGLSKDLRYSCNDESRMLTADAWWTPSQADWTELLTTLIYSAAPKATKISRNGGGYMDAQTYPTATNVHTYGCWHICGNCGPAQQQLSFQIGLCHNSPAQGDNNLSNINQIAFGYHDGFQQLRLECTADTPGNTPVLNGTWQAWVR